MDSLNKFALLLIPICGIVSPLLAQPRKSIPPPHIICTPESPRPIRTVQPIYPPRAAAKKIQGKVLLEVTVAKDGSVSEVSVVKGEPILADAAVIAVKQWKYRPYHLNNQPVELSIRFTVNFSLAGHAR